MELPPKEKKEEESIEGSESGSKDDSQEKQGLSEAANENTDELESIQEEIQEMTKKLEHERIGLRTYKERYEKAFKKYCELRGLPVPQTNEQKQKARERHLKAIKKHKVSDPIIHKKTKVAASMEIESRTNRQLGLNTATAESLQNDINVLVLGNVALKEEINNLRKDKTNAVQQKQKVEAINEEWQEKIDTLKERNKKNEAEIQDKELKQSIAKNKEQNKDFEEQRNKLENDYHQLIEETIKREREEKKEAAKKRQMMSLVSDSKAAFKGANTIELEKQKKMMAEEEISDRTPILMQLLKKWKEINQFKAHMVEKYTKQSAQIKLIFDQMLNFFGLEKYDELPIAIKKGIDQMASIETYITQLTTDVDYMKENKKDLIEKIQILSEKSESDKISDEYIKTHRKEFLKFLRNKINEVKGDIQAKIRFFQRLKPSTDGFLNKMNETYVYDYVHEKVFIEPEVGYTTKSVQSYITSVEDYYKLIQIYAKSMNGENKATEENEFDKLRKEIKLKLENFESKRYITNTLRTSMKNDYYKGNLDFEEIIKKNSEFICSQISRSVNLTEPGMIKKKRTLAPLEV